MFRTAFQLALSSIAYLKVCFEVQKIWLPFFSCQSLLLGTGVPNAITSEERICKLELFVMYMRLINKCTIKLNRYVHGKLFTLE